MFLKMRELSGAYNGLADKVKFIKKCYTSSLMEPRVRRFAERAAGPGPRIVQAERLYSILRKALVYTPDPVGVEMTKSVVRHLDDIETHGRSYGDCDDHACVSYTMLQLIGIPAKLRVAWYTAAMPQHIYTIARINDRWYPFDTTRKKGGFGDESPYTKAMDF